MALYAGVAGLSEAVSRIVLNTAAAVFNPASPSRKIGDSSINDNEEPLTHEHEHGPTTDHDQQVTNPCTKPPIVTTSSINNESSSAQAEASDDDSGATASSETQETEPSTGAVHALLACDPPADVHDRGCVFEGSELPVQVTFNTPNNGLCFGLHFIDCSFNGASPLSFHNSIINNVVFTDCHFEGTRFDNVVMEHMKVVKCTFEESWWSNRVFTAKFITIGRWNDKSVLFDAKREAMDDELPEKLRTPEYKNKLLREQSWVPTEDGWSHCEDTAQDKELQKYEKKEKTSEDKEEIPEDFLAAAAVAAAAGPEAHKKLWDAAEKREGPK
ncbi:hypothetical protein Slin15195_G035270 [Septoria linicola]|uniref:Uncharacterized protein n=1 Tax=Septoria linicola TaxID=215465 RepID=A0A9Q9EIC7_9PEZI|nr:hypothetical protein Slin14017_G034290 [Septoria linicola]USW50208.1 hypothetical protein Slin15195_G035270 [Septoria linicola]